VLDFFYSFPDREAALKRQYTQVKQQVHAAQEKTAEAERREGEARADYRDVLRLVDIMSASPAGIKAVLEAYLKKLGTSARVHIPLNSTAVCNL
jgi:hypothetical protein